MNGSSLLRQRAPTVQRVRLLLLALALMIAAPLCAQRGGGASAPAVPLLPLVERAVTFQQQRAWQSEAARAFRQSLETEPRRQLFDCLRRLIAEGDTAVGAEVHAVLRGNYPTAAEVDAAVELLARANLPLAANTLAVLCHSDPKVLIPAFTRVPHAKRAPLADFVYDRYNPSSSPGNFIKVVSTAVSLYAATPAADLAAGEDLLRFAHLFGFGNGWFNSGTFDQIVERGKNPAAAAAFCAWLLRTFPHDTVLHAELYRKASNLPRAYTAERLRMQRDFLETLPPHYSRPFRVRFFTMLSYSKEEAQRQEFAALRASADKLLAAECHLIAKDPRTASALFREVLEHNAETPYRRLAAWSGLWDTDPEYAATMIAPLVGSIVQLPAGQERTQLIRWFGSEMGRVAPYITAVTLPAERRATAPACYDAMADGLAKLLAADPVACLRANAHNGPSLRYAATLIFTLANRGAEANAVAARTVEYAQTPLPGTTFAPTIAKLKEERTFTAPRVGETEEVIKQCVDAIAEYRMNVRLDRTVMITPEPPNLHIIADQCARIAVSTDANRMREDLKRVGLQLAYAITYLDPKPHGLRLNAPPPPARPMNLQYLAPIRTAILQALDNPLAAQKAYDLFNDGFQPAMLTASNPDLLNAIFDLSVEALDKCVAAKNDDALRGTISNYAGSLGSRQVWDLKPYMKRLQERYLKAE